ncbi:4-aminobutyrate aminotransferase [Brevibacterium sanguinis]|uniref:4-aminobutyrate aminotransferase n=2 Tax=Brevibacterium TaxID=1696 RepID=A0A366IN04_9MICO|nr:MULTISPECIES: aminotransferase class III-fold pyridoxal phosphate-dependent enzyme [Brevibacterium]RBP67020.1 4-aminobutyrate aminotransferase [Brevibacterium sanguinis]RBP73545.1 4-aminobutyrate aminotransferase [Brevibacterium celere]
MSIVEITEEQRRVEEAEYARDQSALAHIENLRFFPLAVSSGSGATLTSASGRELIDLSASWTASALGHGQPDIAEAVARAAGTGAGASALSAAVAETTRLAERLLTLVPVRQAQRAYLGLSGSDANAAAIEAARRATGRPTIVSFTGSYHGGFGSSREVSGIGWEPVPGSRVLDYPVTEADLAGVRPRLDRALAPGDVAAVIVEAVQCDGGVRVPAAGFLPLLREACDEAGAHLIVDEVKAGLARTGRLFAFEHSGIRPDIVTLGKSLGGGLPVSAAVGPASVLDVVPATALLTAAGAPICAAAANAVLDLLSGTGPTGRAEELGALARERLADFRRTDRPGSRAIAEVRGRGLLLGIEVASGLAAATVYRAWELGAVIYPVGDDVLELTPPLSITESELELGLDIVLHALDDAASGRVPTEALERFGGW